MIEAAQIFETMVRGGAVGVLLLLAAILFTTGRERRARLGGLFALASASVALVSSTTVFPLLGAAAAPLVVLAIMLEEMSIAPSWATGLPLAAEGKITKCYTK